MTVNRLSYEVRRQDSVYKVPSNVQIIKVSLEQRWHLHNVSEQQ